MHLENFKNIYVEKKKLNVFVMDFEMRKSRCLLLHELDTALLEFSDLFAVK